MVPTTKLAMDGEVAEGRREGKRWREREQWHMNEMEDMTAATCSKPSPNPAAGRGCIDSSATIDADIDPNDQP